MFGENDVCAKRAPDRAEQRRAVGNEILETSTLLHNQVDVEYSGYSMYGCNDLVYTYLLRHRANV